MLSEPFHIEHCQTTLSPISSRLLTQRLVQFHSNDHNPFSHSRFQQFPLTHHQKLLHLCGSQEKWFFSPKIFSNLVGNVFLASASLYLKNGRMNRFLREFQLSKSTLKRFFFFVYNSLEGPLERWKNKLYSFIFVFWCWVNALFRNYWKPLSDAYFLDPLFCIDEKFDPSLEILGNFLGSL